MRLEDTNLRPGAIRAMREAGIQDFGDAIDRSIHELLSLPGFGVESLRDLGQEVSWRLYIGQLDIYRDYRNGDYRGRKSA